MPSVLSKYHFFFLTLIFIAFVILRFYDIDHRLVFAMDQIQNAWVMKDMIVNGKLPLLGMAVRQDSGLFVGPGYYYLLAPFYWIYNLDPIAGGIFAGVIGILTFGILYWVAKNIFSKEIALVAVFIYTFSNNIINSDRIAWPVVLLPLVSTLIFYFLYKIISGQSQYLLALAITIGIAFHVHFTAIFFPFIILLISPWIICHKGWKKYVLPSFILFVIWFIPSFILQLQSKNLYSSNFFGYFLSSFSGIHLRRVVQLLPDAFIEFQKIFGLFHVPIFISISILFLFFGLIWNDKVKRPLVWLVGFWFVVPWFILSLYRGEISDYFFTITRPVAVLILSYGIFWLILKYRLAANLSLFFLILFAYLNVVQFAHMGNTDFPLHRFEAIRAIKEKRQIPFTEFNAESYLFYVYTRKNYAIQ